MVLITLLLERAILFVCTQFILRFIPYEGFFPYREELLKYHLPKYIYSLANFDGVHYIQIARKGYEQYTQAYFPLYSVVISLGGYLVHNHLLVALIIAISAAWSGLIFGSRFVERVTESKQVSWWSVMFLLTYPTSFFFSTAYTESLFFFFISLSLLMMVNKKPVAAGLAALFASLTRFMGIFMIIPLVFAFIQEKKIPRWKKIIAYLGPLTGTGIYIAYLWITSGDPLYFIHAQSAFGANRSTHIILLPVVMYRYIKIFITASHNLQYYISVIEFVTFMFVGVVLVYDIYRLWKDRAKKHTLLLIGLSFFSLLTILIPASSGTLSSIPRYSLLSVSFFIALARYCRNNIIKTAIAICFILTQIILFGLFMQGYFVS